MSEAHGSHSVSKRISRRLVVRQNERGIQIGSNNNERGFIGAGVINVVFGIILTLLALRFVLRLLGANPLNAFASLIYNLSQPLVSPFFGLFNYQAQLETARFELATLIALLVYGTIAGLVSRLLLVNRYNV